MDLVPALFSASSIAAVTVLAVANIDNPSTELNARAGATNGEECTVYQAVVGANAYTTYRFDSASSASVSVPYIIAASGSGQWIAVAGKYVNSAVNISGNLVVGDGTISALARINGAAATVRQYALATAGIARWSIRSDATAESGSNAGSDFALIPFTDGGSSLTTAISIVRSTSAVTVGAAFTSVGQTALSGSANANSAVTVGGTNPLSGTSQFGLLSDFRGTSAATVTARAGFFRGGTAAAAFVCPEVTSLIVGNNVIGAGSTATRAFGIVLNGQTGGTNNYGLAHTASPTGATAGNYFLYDDVGYPSRVGGVWTFTGQITTGINSGSTINVDVTDTAASRSVALVRVNTSATAHTTSALLDVISAASTSADKMFRLRANSVDVMTVAADGATVITGSVAVTSSGTALVNLSPTAGSASELRMGGGTGHYNWILGPNFNINQAYEITPSTATGGSTFTTPGLVIFGATRNVVLGASTDDGSNKLQITGTMIASSTIRSGLDTGVGAFAINGAAANDRELNFQTASSNRWRFRCNSTAESGGNAGSDLQILARSDTGTAIDTPIQITRAAGGAIAFLTRPVTITTTAAANALAVTGATGQYAAVFNGFNGAGVSFGPNINAGSNSSDQALVVADRTGVNPYLTVRGDGSLALMGTGSYGGGAKVIFISNATTDPTTNPSGGGILFCSAGALKYRGSSGTVTTLGVA